ncbi:hypothetical protein CONPUDRAFT_70146 [Coniophora puteana RWD-64-598 SS2]|uniref:Uncharacterized protein n=1 Tax=Coniophora puteana (strain RWD-64-598) TaxID=741705 RepID=A0A5M3N205_CONPW|nr:uncharacterized protein CONPUDRAFT_70146 [Coniophora puteana RWD-64-598 SS2]EIW85307.1 hypothetical protein CONPUDRAFT_70146 [Coniophora puteana RWD-64-598 SS2]
MLYCPEFAAAIQVPEEPQSFIITSGHPLFILIHITLPILATSSLTNEKALSCQPHQTTPFDYHSVPIAGSAHHLDKATLQLYWEYGFCSLQIEFHGAKIFTLLWLAVWWYNFVHAGKAKGRWVSTWDWATTNILSQLFSSNFAHIPPAIKRFFRTTGWGLHVGGIQVADLADLFSNRLKRGCSQLATLLMHSPREVISFSTINGFHCFTEKLGVPLQACIKVFNHSLQDNSFLCGVVMLNTIEQAPLQMYVRGCQTPRSLNMSSMGCSLPNIILNRHRGAPSLLVAPAFALSSLASPAPAPAPLFFVSPVPASTPAASLASTPFHINNINDIPNFTNIAMDIDVSINLDDDDDMPSLMTHSNLSDSDSGSDYDNDDHPCSIKPLVSHEIFISLLQTQLNMFFPALTYTQAEAD